MNGKKAVDVIPTLLLHLNRLEEEQDGQGQDLYI